MGSRKHRTHYCIPTGPARAACGAKTDNFTIDADLVECLTCKKIAINVEAAQIALTRKTAAIVNRDDDPPHAS